VLAATVLEAWLVSDGWFTYLGVGLIEETVKLVALIGVARGLTTYRMRDGIVLGATVGMGFAAFESSGYALGALLTSAGHPGQLSLQGLVFTEMLRGILAPVGHGLWTAILGGVVFAAASRHNRLRVSWGVVWAFLLVVVLHALWDSMHGIAAILTALITTTRAQQIAITMGQQVHPTDSQVATFTALNWGGLVIISIVGLAVLWAEWRRGRSRDQSLPA
jgi:RsiW-degrading membrane proteinase PrsW (M82 family)